MGATALAYLRSAGKRRGARGPARLSEEVMSKTAINHNSKKPSLPKAATGIQGLDEITGGGLPRGRPTLVCGSSGAGKTLLAVEFLVRGAAELGEPGVFMAFEETAEELAQNVRSLGFDLEQLAAQNKLLVDYVHVERSEMGSVVNSGRHNF